MQTIYLDISNKGVVPTIYAKQGDVGRRFEVVFTNSGLPYVIADESFLSVWYNGESGEGNYTEIDGHSAFTVNANKVVIEIITQALENDGNGVFCLILNEPGGRQIGSWNIPYICEAIPGFGSEEAKAYYTAFSDSIEKLYQTTENLTPESIGAAPAGYGLGNTSPKSINGVAAMDVATANGFYYVTGIGGSIFGGVPVAQGLLFVIGKDSYHTDHYFYPAGTDAILWREMESQVWGEWCCQNPPMVPGVEYRTTERWNGKAVYTQMRNGLSFPNASYRDIDFGINNSAKVIRYRHIAYGPDMCEMPIVSGTAVLAYGYFAQSNNGLVYLYKTSTDLTSYTESYIQVWYTKE